MKNAVIGPLFLLVVAANAGAQDSNFRWLNRTTDLAVFKQVQAAFSVDLTPGKFIKRIGLRGSSALVVIGEKESKSDPYTVSRAFSLDVRTNAKSPLRT